MLFLFLRQTSNLTSTHPLFPGDVNFDDWNATACSILALVLLLLLQVLALVRDPQFQSRHECDYQDQLPSARTCLYIIEA